MKLLNNIAYKLRKCPKLKRVLKDFYQHIGNIVSDKKTKPSNIVRVSNNNYEHLFGYYDKCPWNKDENKMIYLEVKDASKKCVSDTQAKIILYDFELHKECVISETRCWNVQQGCMLGWLGPDFNTNIIYNDFIDNELKAIILNVKTKKKKIIDFPVYSVADTGEVAVSLDFYRLNRLRPGYGYNNKKDLSIGKMVPDGYCIWQIDLKNNMINGIIKYDELLKIDYKESMANAEHKVNHIMINPSATRFMFLHRWIKNGVKYTRLLTADIDGKNIYNLLDDDMVSHCFWKDDEHILGWARKKELGNHYYLLKDKTSEFKIIGKEKLLVDGHPSYSKDLRLFVTDTYPDFKRKQHLYLFDEKDDKKMEIASIYASVKYLNDCRCDLHPRFNYSGNKICFDGSQEGKREVYVLDISNNANCFVDLKKCNKIVSIIIPIYNVEKYLERCLDSVSKQTYTNIEVLLIDDCSTDSSANIAKKYTNNDKRFKYIKCVKNKGASSARNKGIKNAVGDYICFVDSDDWVSEYYVEKLLSSAIFNNSEITVCDYIMSYDNGEQKKGNSLSLINNQSSINEKIAYIRNHPVAKLFEKKFLFKQKIEFPENIKRAEDISTIIPLLTHAKNISIIDDGLYYYYQRDNSTSNISDKSRIDLSFYDETIDLMVKRSQIKYKDEIEYHCIIELMYGKIMLMIQHQYNNKEIKQYIEEFNKTHKNWIKNKYISKMNKLKRLFIKCSRKKMIFALRLMVFINNHRK